MRLPLRKRESGVKSSASPAGKESRKLPVLFSSILCRTCSIEKVYTREEEKRLIVTHPEREKESDDKHTQMKGKSEQKDREKRERDRTLYANALKGRERFRYFSIVF